MSIFYKNEHTGEITFERKEAAEWFSDGDRVSIINGRNDETICNWTH